MSKPTKLTFTGQLETIPMHNRHIRVQAQGKDRGATVEIDLKYHGLAKMLQGILRLRTSRRYELDGIGLEVFNRIDNHKTFEQLIDEFADHHKLTFFESRALLMQYLQMLMSRGIIAVGVPPDKG